MKIHLHSFISIFFLSIHLATQAQESYQPNLKDPDLRDHPEFAHAMNVETRKIDDVSVVYHYNQVRPDFDDLTENETRKITKLDSSWKFKFDPKGVGIEQEWYQPETNQVKSRDWLDINVPHCWDAMPGASFWKWDDQSHNNPSHYNGAAWYQKTFEYSPSSKDTAGKKHQRIVFLGVQQRARIYINGKEIAKHEGGGAPFSIDITENLTTGTNTLALKVVRLPNFLKHPEGKNKGDKGWKELDYIHTLHPKAPDCWPYAGILRDVFFVEESSVTIRKTLIHATENDLKAIMIISNHGEIPVEMRAVLNSNIDPDKNKESELFTVNPKQTLIKRIELLGAAKNAKPWSPGSPNIYTSNSLIVTKSGEILNKQATQFGVRKFVVDGRDFKLNDEAIFLKGASIYEEHHTRGGAITKQDHKDNFNLLHDSKSNFARLHVIQRDPYAYKLANEQGIMVCGEWGGFWYKAKSMGAQTKDEHSIYQTMARCGVWDMLNHPSVVLWGLNNECHQFCKEYEPFLKMSRELVLEIDYQKRPITWSAWHPHKGQPHFEHADAIGFNEYRGAMDPFKDLDPDLEKVIKQNPNKPFIIMENGAWSKRGSRGNVNHKNNENWQADLLKRQWEVLTKHTPEFSGYTYWLLKDYRSRKPYTGNKGQNGYSRMGIYDGQNLPKELVREAYLNLADPLKVKK